MQAIGRREASGPRHRPRTPLDVSVDKLKIKQALGNIIRNAIEVSPPGTVVSIRTGTADDGTAEVTVSDRGPGVPAANREAIFTPFFTTKEHGTGLGLAIAREFADAHGGRLWVEDRAERPGATFVLRLPLTGSNQRDAHSGSHSKAKLSRAG
jgi:signal transduction histidine kinase